MERVGSSGSAAVTLPTDEQILITREFNAPRELVYRAWTTPELVRRWWSGERGDMIVCEIDLRVGGSWRYAMSSGDGFEIAFRGEYREIVPLERIVATEVFEAMPGDGVLTTVTLSDQGGRTRLSQLIQCATNAERDLIINSGMETGVQEGMDLLEQVARSLQ